jgi:hypothetical protein
LQRRLDTAPQFAVSKLLTQSLTVGRVAFEKAGEHRATLAPTLRERVGPRWAIGTVRVPVSMNFRPQNHDAVAKTLLTARSSEDDRKVL